MWGVYSPEITDIKVHLQHILCFKNILSLFAIFTPRLLFRKKLFFFLFFYFPIIYCLLRNLINKAVWHERVAVVWQIPGWGMGWHHEPVRWHSWWSGAVVLISCWLCVLCILRMDLLHFWKDSLDLWLCCLYSNRPESLNNSHLPFLTDKITVSVLVMETASGFRI